MDCKLQFVEKGSGMGVLLVHGFPFDHTIWSRQIDALAKTYRVIAPDLRGHGKTPASPGAYAMEDHARDLLALIDGLHLMRFVAVGHSMGGYILFALHRIAADRLAGLAFVSSRAAADTQEARAARLANAERALKEGTKFLVDSMTMKVLGANPRAAAALEVKRLIGSEQPQGVAGELRGLAARPDSTCTLASLKLPVLVVAGRQDKIVSPAESEAMSKAVPGAKLAWMENSGHMPMLEEPEKLIDALKQFLNSI